MKLSKFHQKQKKYPWDQKCSIWVFGLECCHTGNQHLLIYLIQNFVQKLEFLNSELKNVLFGCLGQQFWKTIVIFEISTLEFCKVLCKKIKILIFGTKNARFAYFGTRIWKYYCHIWNRHPQIWVTAKFCEIIKIPKLGIKNALFGYFWAWILKNYCHIWNW